MNKRIAHILRKAREVKEHNNVTMWNNDFQNLVESTRKVMLESSFLDSMARSPEKLRIHMSAS